MTQEKQRADGVELAALSGLKVLDCASYLAGPYCATMLGEFGADVIKVEQPGVGDAFRKFGTKTQDDRSLLFLSENRNKRSVTINLKQPEGAEVLKKLAGWADIMVENFQPGTLEGWGLGYDVLSAVNPRLIMVRVSGYGQTGPMSRQPGFGRIGNAFGGLSFLAGYPDRAPVTPGSATLADYMSGLFAAYGALVAVQARERTGRGQEVDIGLYESIFRVLDELAPAYHATGNVRQRMGPGTVNVVPHSHYPTSDGRWVAIACTNDKMFARLAKAMGDETLASAGRFGAFASREAAREEVDAIVSSWTQSLTRDEVLSRCEAEEVPSGPLYAIDEIFDCPQYAARGNLAMIPDEVQGQIAMPNVVPRLTDTPGTIASAGPSLGAHTDEVLMSIAGLTDEEVARLRSSRVI